MKRLAAVFVVLFAACLPSSGSANADPLVLDFGDVLYRLDGAITVPPEWEGVWSVVDSVFMCTGVFLQTTSHEDTLCGGHIYTQAPPGTVVPFTCSGTADATTIHATCTGSFEVFPDCQATNVVDVDWTRTGDSYSSVTEMNTTYSGTGKDCDLLPPTCIRIRSKGTRTPPGVDCATPVRSSTWGQIKIRYR